MRKGQWYGTMGQGHGTMGKGNGQGRGTCMCQGTKGKGMG